jgi:hypothetical protein
LYQKLTASGHSPPRCIILACSGGMLSRLNWLEVDGCVGDGRPVNDRIAGRSSSRGTVDRLTHFLYWNACNGCWGFCLNKCLNKWA